MKRVILLVSLFVLALPACKKEESAEQKFWAWFQANSKRLHEFEKDREKIFDELDAEMDKVDKGLQFEFGPDEEGVREFTIGAGGIKAVFPVVKDLVAAAPKMKEWKILAFRQPKSLDYRIKFGDQELTVDDFWFSYEKAPDGKTDIKVFIRGLNQENKSTMHQLAFLFLDSAIGEYNVATKIGGIHSSGTRSSVSISTRTSKGCANFCRWRSK